MAAHTMKPSDTMDTMKVIEAHWLAIPWAASSTVPIQPIIIAEAKNRPTSARIVSPIGQPSLRIWKKTGQSLRQNRPRMANRRSLRCRIV